MAFIVSSLPGRIRVRHPALREPARLAQLEAAAVRWRGVQSAKADPRAGSLLLHYDAARLERRGLEARLEAAARRLVPAAGRHAPSTRVRINRLAKRGMLAGLGASLLFAAAGAKRLHIVTGGFFLAGLAAHLAVHRRHLLR